MAGFFDGLSAVGILSGAVDIFKAKEQTKVAKVEAQTKAAEDAQRVALEKAKVQQQAEVNAAAIARQTFNNEMMWKLASWMTMGGGLLLAGAVAARIFKGK